MSQLPPPPPPPPGAMPPPSAGDAVPPMQPKPPNYLVWSILATILCCVPLGIVGIVHAARVDGHYREGRYAQAVAESEKAKRWTMITVGAGLVVLGVAWALDLF